MCDMAVIVWISGVFLLMFINCKDAFGLKDVKLVIEPRVVEYHHHSILRCAYDLENASLYTVKWYRGHHEFYRYTPSEHPSTKVFPVNGITVDTAYSNSTQVFLHKVEFILSGDFSCEVTTEPPISTGVDSKTMLVVQLPENPPTISVGRERLDYGHILRANCSSPPSRPAASLQFILNNITVARNKPQSNMQEASWSDLMLDLPLSEIHFSGGRLELHCVAKIADVYQEDAVLLLESARDPVPARVRSPNSAPSVQSYGAVVTILNIVLLTNTGIVRLF